jgi:alpha-glucuronidase
MAIWTENNPEYDCWFQYRGAEGLPFPRETLEKIRLFSPPGGTEGEILAQAKRELAGGLGKLFGLEVREGEGILIGLRGELNRAQGLALSPPGAEGFVIRAEPGRVLIAGEDGPGTLYGVYRFLSLLAQGTPPGPGRELAEAPAAPLRMLNHWDNLDGTVERGYAGPSLFFKDNRLDYEPRRIEDYARLLASVGINRLSINNVNVRGEAKKLITEAYLPEIARLAGIFRPFGIRLLLSVNFSAPRSLGGLPTADPLDPAVGAWWQERAALVYRHIPDLAGFLVKADSEGEPGPFQYGRTHAQGANMLAAALEPWGGLLIWRCFVYNAAQDWRDTATDRARAAYDHFMPQDGAFAKNALLQIKHGPYDFQVREPVSPLFGALQKTRHLMELQITQEYTGHQIDLCYLPSLWEWVLDYDTGYGPGAKIRELLGKSAQGKAVAPSPQSPPGEARLEGLAGVGNLGLDRNWTGHPLAQANLYGFGRLAWNPSLGAREIAREWSLLSFGPGTAGETVERLLLGSYGTYEKYNAPFGVCFMVTPGLHYGPSVEGYEFSRWGTYHRADRTAIGVDRTEQGTGYVGQYPPANARRFGSRESCPENLILFFHRLPYDYVMKNRRTLLQNIYDTHFEGYEEVERMRETWLSLEGLVDGGIFAEVRQRLDRQLENAREWRDQINTCFYRKTGIPDEKGRKIYP